MPTLLLIDDDPIILEVLSLLLNDAGWTVTAANGGEAALRILGQTKPPAMILSDLQMPGLCGPALAQRIRQLAPASVLLAMTATPVPTNFQGYDARLVKPFGAEAVEEHYQSVLKQQRESTTSSVKELSSPVLERSPEPSNVPVFHTEVLGLVMDPVTYEQLQKAMPADRLSALLQLVADDADLRIERLRQAITDCDDKAYRTEAHALKGSCRMVGAIQLGELAARAEGLGLSDGIAPKWNPVSDFVQAVGDFRDMLKTL